MTDAKRILELVGGESNVSSVSHCVTRLRFVLKNPEIAKIEEIEALKMVKGTFTSAGQFQVIIGPGVEDAYKELIVGTELAAVSKEQVKEDAKQNMTALQRSVAFLAEVFTPILPAIIVGGLILGFRNLLEFPFFADGTMSMVMMDQFWAGLDSFLWLIGEAIFAFLPVHVCWSVYKKLGGTEVLGIVLGITLVSPQLLNAYSVASTPASEIPVWDFGYFTIEMIGYQAMVIPALFVGITGAYIEKWMNKVTPNFLRLIIVPFVVLIVTVVLAHTVIGPIGWFLSDVVANTVTWLLTTLGFVGGAIFGFFYAPLVVTGLHHTTIAIDMTLIAETGGTQLWPMIALSNIAQGSAVVATVVYKKTVEAKEIGIPAAISAYLGVTEPALYGVNLKWRYPMIAAMIGAGLASGLSVMWNVTANSIGIGGLPGFLSIQPQYMLQFFICMAVAIVVPIVLTLIFAARETKKSLKAE